MDLIITILPVVTKDLPISPRLTPYEFLSRCKLSNLTTRQPKLYLLLTFPRFPLRKKEHKSYFGKNRIHAFRTTSRCGGYLLDHSGDNWKDERLTAHRYKIKEGMLRGDIDSHLRGNRGMIEPLLQRPLVESKIVLVSLMLVVQGSKSVGSSVAGVFPDIVPPCQTSFPWPSLNQLNISRFQTLPTRELSLYSPFITTILILFDRIII